MTASAREASIARTDDLDLREVMAQFATGVTVVTATAPDGRHFGTTANAVTSVSLDPPLILVCLRNESETLAALLEAGSFAVTVLAHHQHEIASRFARRAEKDTWHKIPFRIGDEAGAPLLHEGLTSVECGIHRIDDGGDHRIVIGRVLAAARHRHEEQPLVFFRSAFTRLASGPIDAEPRLRRAAAS